MPETPTYSFPYPAPPDTDLVPEDMGELAQAIEDRIEITDENVAANHMALESEILVVNGKADTALANAASAGTAASSAVTTANTALTTAQKKPDIGLVIALGG